MRDSDSIEATRTCKATIDGDKGADGKQPPRGKSHRQCEIDWLKARIEKTFGKGQAGPKALCTDYLCRYSI